MKSAGAHLEASSVAHDVTIPISSEPESKSSDAQQIANMKSQQLPELTERGKITAYLALANDLNPADGLFAFFLML